MEQVSLGGVVVRTLGDISRQRDPLLQEIPLVVAGHPCDRVKDRPRFSKVDSPQGRCQDALTRQIRLPGTRAGLASWWCLSRSWSAFDHQIVKKPSCPSQTCAQVSVALCDSGVNGEIRGGKSPNPGKN
jgi:hypothetical protein